MRDAGDGGEPGEPGEGLQHVGNGVACVAGISVDMVATVPRKS